MSTATASESLQAIIDAGTSAELAADRQAVADIKGDHDAEELMGNRMFGYVRLHRFAAWAEEADWPETLALVTHELDVLGARPVGVSLTIRWLSGATYSEYIGSEFWRDARRAALRNEPRCQICHADRDLQVHHKTYERLRWERLADLATVCTDCHGMLPRGWRGLAA